MLHFFWSGPVQAVFLRRLPLARAFAFRVTECRFKSVDGHDAVGLGGSR